jgi:hypothetical protein
MRRIKDEFADLPVSHQRKSQLRMRRDGRCMKCGEPMVMRGLCLKHWIANRERQRKKLGCKRRYLNALSYKLEAKAKAPARRKRREKIRGRGGGRARERPAPLRF